MAYFELNGVSPDRKGTPIALPSLSSSLSYKGEESEKRGTREACAFLREGCPNNISKLMSCELIQRGSVGFAPPFCIR